jgi:hypothetical protein
MAREMRGDSTRLSVGVEHHLIEHPVHCVSLRSILVTANVISMLHVNNVLTIAAADFLALGYKFVTRLTAAMSKEMNCWEGGKRHSPIPYSNFSNGKLCCSLLLGTLQRSRLTPTVKTFSATFCATSVTLSNFALSVR